MCTYSLNILKVIKHKSKRNPIIFVFFVFISGLISIFNFISRSISSFSPLPWTLNHLIII